MRFVSRKVFYLFYQPFFYSLSHSVKEMLVSSRSQVWLTLVLFLRVLQVCLVIILFSLLCATLIIIEMTIAWNC